MFPPVPADPSFGAELRRVNANTMPSPGNHNNKAKGPASQLSKATNKAKTAFSKLTGSKPKSSNKEDQKHETTKLESNESASDDDSKPKESNPKKKTTGKKVKEFLKENVHDADGVIGRAMLGAL